MVENEVNRPLDRALPPRHPGRGAPGAEPHDGSVRELGRTLSEGRWVILLVTAVGLLAAAGYAFVTPPAYRASALLQVEPRPEGGRRLEDLSALFEPRASADSEIEILRSRLVVGTALDSLDLDVEAHPAWLPVVGQALARRFAGPGLAEPPHPRLARYAWGGERIVVRSLQVPDALVGKELTLIALGGGRYRLTGPDGALLLEGQANAVESADVPGGRLAVVVAELTARPGTEFRLTRLARTELVDRVLRALSVSERGVGTGVIGISYEAGDPARAAAMVSALCSAYLQQDAAKSQAEAARTLAFLETQLPQLKANLDAAEGALNGYREQRGTVDLPLEAKAAVDRTLELDRAISDLEVARAQMALKYSDQHPDVKVLERQLAAAKAEREALVSRKLTMPRTQLGSARLERNVEMAADLYLTLLKKAQELRVVRSGRTGSVRVVDWPTPPVRPVRPKPLAALALGLLLGLAGGVTAALGRRAMDENADDPRDIEDGTGLPVYVTIPHSPREVSLQRRAGPKARVPLALAAPDDAATETLRTLRTALGFVLKARGKVVAVSSPSAGVGKSFVCANLAHLMAAAGQRVLLVDADLRQGRLHRYFSAEQAPGLCEVLAGEVRLEEAVRGTGTAGLEILARGEQAHSPAELLARPRLAELLAAASSRYDVVLVDTPPILSVTDALLVARFASVNLLVLRAGQHPMPEIAEAMELFTRSGVPVHGGILNDARPGSGYGRSYAHRPSAPVVARVAG